MNKRRLGKTNLFLTEIGFGAASIGNLYQPCTAIAAHEVIKTCWDLGIRYFDTAPEYGHGLSERRLGDALREYPRHEYVLSTKVGDLLYAHHHNLPPSNKFINKLPFHLRYDYSYDAIMRAFEDSLQRLGLNYIDIVLVHDLDPIVHEKEIFSRHFYDYINSGYPALAKLKNEGVIKAIGLGVKKWQVCFDVMQYGDYDCFMLQGNYTLLEQTLANHFVEACQLRQISLLLAGPFASGILATGAVKGAYFNHREAHEEILQRVRLIEKICSDFNTPLPAAALQFPLTHPLIASVVVGAASANLMHKNIEFYQHTIADELWKTLLT